MNGVRLAAELWHVGDDNVSLLAEAYFDADLEPGHSTFVVLRTCGGPLHHIHRLVLRDVEALPQPDWWIWKAEYRWNDGVAPVVPVTVYTGAPTDIPTGTARLRVPVWTGPESAPSHAVQLLTLRRHA